MKGEKMEFLKEFNTKPGTTYMIYGEKNESINDPVDQVQFGVPYHYTKIVCFKDYGSITYHASAKCVKEDKFSMEFGMKLAQVRCDEKYLHYCESQEKLLKKEYCEKQKECEKIKRKCLNFKENIDHFAGKLADNRCWLIDYMSTKM